MKIANPRPKSSFLTVEKDLNIIINKILENERLKRLLYYNTPDCLYKSNLTEEQSLGLIGKNIKCVPKIQVDDEVLNYLLINFDNFSPSSNPEFRDNTIMFDILCHYNQWQLRDMQLRPYKIAAELDSMLNNSRLTGIGLLQFVGASQLLMDNELGGLCLIYNAVHGEEDKKFMTTPQQEKIFQQDVRASF